MSRGERRWTGLIEVKLSESRQYMADGLYKVLAYLRDFAKVLDNQPPPRAMLVTWNGLKHFEPTEDVGLVTANQMTSQMRPFVQAAYQAIA